MQRQPTPSSKTKIRKRASTRFFLIVREGPVLWNDEALRKKLGQNREEVGARLGRLAESRRWAKLRDPDGVIRAIGEPARLRQPT